MAQVEPRKFGRFHISSDAFRGERMLDMLGALFSQLFPVSALHNFSCDRIEYVAYSRHFRDVPMNEATPFYNVMVSRALPDCPVCGRPAHDHTHVGDTTERATPPETQEELRSAAAAQPPTYSFEFVEVSGDKCDALTPWW